MLLLQTMIETLGRDEVLSPEEQGKLAYETAENLVSQLSQLSEFREALVRTYFTRGKWYWEDVDFPSKGSWHEVRFLKGRYEYSICYLSNRGFGEEGINSIQIKLNKFDSENPRRMSIGLHLGSKFRENEKGDKKFEGGIINLECYGRNVQNPGVKTDREAAKMIPIVLGEIFREPIKL